MSDLRCKDCGGMMIGDGYHSVYQCEMAFVPTRCLPDAPPVYCKQITLLLNDEEYRDVLSGLEALQDSRCCSQEERDDVQVVIDEIERQRNG